VNQVIGDLKIGHVPIHGQRFALPAHPAIDAGCAPGENRTRSRENLPRRSG
jgi:hypothetical protein